MLTIILLVSGFTAACNVQPVAPIATSTAGTLVRVEGGVYTNITPAQLAEMLRSKDFVFVNTHTPYDGEIEQTDAFIPFVEDGPKRVGEYPADKNAGIVLYCRSGRMSAIVAEELVKAGYTHVRNLEGGMKAWEQAGYKLIRK